jgi:hypothetical protein
VEAIIVFKLVNSSIIAKCILYSREWTDPNSYLTFWKKERAEEVCSNIEDQNHIIYEI